MQFDITSIATNFRDSVWDTVDENMKDFVFNLKFISTFNFAFITSTVVLHQTNLTLDVTNKSNHLNVDLVTLFFQSNKLGAVSLSIVCVPVKERGSAH